MPTNTVRDDREAEWQAGYGMCISSMNECPILARLNITICKTNSYITHISNYNIIAW